jgi:hypothetical protein
MRMSMRRFTCLTHALSKKFENHCHALALSFVFPRVRGGISFGEASRGRCLQAVRRFSGFSKCAPDLPDVSILKASTPAAAGYFAWGCFRYF